MERTGELLTRSASQRLINNHINESKQRFQDFKKVLFELLELKDLDIPNYIINLSQTDAEGTVNDVGYIRWDLLSILLNKQFINSDEKGNQVSLILNDRFLPKNKNSYLVDPLFYIDPIENKDVIDASCDVNVCILPHQFNFPIGNFKKELKASLGGSFPSVNSINSIPQEYIISVSPQDRASLDFSQYNKDLTKRIGNIFISLPYLINIFEKNKTNDNATVGSIVKEIWDGINKVCPLHNFVISDADSNYVHIIDLITDNGELPSIDKLYEFVPFSNENTLREFSYESRVPNSLASTIAIRAQDPKSVEDLEGVTALAFNRSIKNRIQSTNTDSNIDNTRKNIESNKFQYKEELVSLQQQIAQYCLEFYKDIESIGIDSEFNQGISKGFATNMIGKYKRYTHLQNYIRVAENSALPNNAVIPLSFNATLDGISGLVIGNVFKIKKDRLPKAYKYANIGFIVFGEEQSITAGQDWTTKIDGKMIILDDPSKKIKPLKYVDEQISQIAQEGLKDSTQTEISQETIPQGMEEVTPGATVYLKRIKFDQKLKVDNAPLDATNLPKTYEGLSYVRTTPNIDNEAAPWWKFGFGNGDNVIGAFDCGRDFGLELGTVQEIRKIPYEGNLIRVTSNYYGTRSEVLAGTTPLNQDNPNIPIPALVIFHFLLSKNSGVFSYTTESSDYYEVEYEVEPSPIKIKISKKPQYIIESASVWYRILFTKIASDKFLNGYVYDSRTKTIDSDGADNQLPSGDFLFNKSHWMRIDTLASTPEEAANTEAINLSELSNP